MRKILTLIAIGLLFLSCKESRKDVDGEGGPEAPVESYERGVYHWKTTFEITEEDSTFIKEHNINRL